MYRRRRRFVRRSIRGRGRRTYGRRRTYSRRRGRVGRLRQRIGYRF